MIIHSGMLEYSFFRIHKGEKNQIRSYLEIIKIIIQLD